MPEVYRFHLATFVRASAVEDVLIELGASPAYEFGGTIVAGPSGVIATWDSLDVGTEDLPYPLLDLSKVKRIEQEVVEPGESLELDEDLGIGITGVES